MNEMLGYCGIKCDACDIRKATRDPEFAKVLSEKWKKFKPDAKPEWFKCQGCKGGDEGHWSPDCKIRTCASKRGVTHCGECPDLKCSIIDAFANDGNKHHRKAVEYLESLRQPAP